MKALVVFLLVVSVGELAFAWWETCEISALRARCG
jgi:hypothetical protein